MIKLKNWQAAAEYSQRCLENNGNDPQALLNRGWVAFYQKDLELALRLVKLSNELHRDADCLYKLGRIYWEMGGELAILMSGEYKNSKEYALSYFLQSAKQNTSYAPSFCYLGFYYDLIENDHNRAMKCFQKSIQLDSSNADANKALVMLKLKERKESEAIEILHSFCGHYPRNDWAHKSLGDLLVVICYIFAKTRILVNMQMQSFILINRCVMIPKTVQSGLYWVRLYLTKVNMLLLQRHLKGLLPLRRWRKRISTYHIAYRQYT